MKQLILGLVNTANFRLFATAYEASMWFGRHLLSIIFRKGHWSASMLIKWRVLPVLVFATGKMLV